MIEQNNIRFKAGKRNRHLLRFYTAAFIVVWCCFLFNANLIFADEKASEQKSFQPAGRHLCRTNPDDTLILAENDKANTEIVVVQPGPPAADSKSDKCSIGRPLLSVAKVGIPPIIDGRIDDTCWVNAPRFSNFVEIAGDSLAREQTMFRILYDDANLYIAVECRDSQPDKIKAENKIHDSDVWEDDCIEIFLDTNYDHNTYYHFIINALGTRREDLIIDPKWDINWQARATINKDGWIAEISIPFDGLKLVRKEGFLGEAPVVEGATWGLNVSRHQTRLEEYSAWSPTFANSFHIPITFGDMVFRNSSSLLMVDSLLPGIVNGGLAEEKSGSVKVTNQSEKEYSLQWRLNLVSPLGKTTSTTQDFKLAPGSGKELPLVNIDKEIKEGNAVFLSFKISDVATGDVYYRSANFPLRIDEDGRDKLAKKKYAAWYFQLFGNKAIKAEHTVREYPRLEEFFLYGVYGYPCTHALTFDEKYSSWQIRYGGFGRDLVRHYMNAGMLASNFDEGLELFKQYGIHVPYLGTSEFNIRSGEDEDSYTERIKRVVLKYKDQDNLLFWYAIDEPGPGDLDKYLLRKKIVEGIDSNHPALCIFSGTAAQYRSWTPYCQVFIQNRYPINVIREELSRELAELEKNGKTESSRYRERKKLLGSQWFEESRGRNPWRVEENMTDNITATDKPVWMLLQGHSFRDLVFPTVPEFRLQTYLALAGGAKGIWYFIYNSPGTWGEYHFEIPLTLVDEWGNPTPLWDEVGRMGRYIASVGPLLLKTKKVDSSLVQPECDLIDTFETRRPVIQTGILINETREIDYLVIYNNDLTREQQCRVKVDTNKTKGKRLYDLYDLVKVPLAGNSFPVNLLPGDGRIFSLATAEEYLKDKKQIQKVRFENEKRIIGLDMELAKKSNLEIGEVERLMRKADSLAAKSKYDRALRKLADGSNKLKEAFIKNQEFYKSMENLRKARDFLGKIGDMLEEKVVSRNKEARTSSALLWKYNKNDVWSAEDQKVKPCVDLIGQLSGYYFKLWELFYLEGKGKDIVSDTRVLLELVSQLEKQAISFFVNGQKVEFKLDEAKINALRERISILAGIGR